MLYHALSMEQLSFGDCAFFAAKLLYKDNCDGVNPTVLIGQPTINYVEKLP